ncbi:hypothetical protein [Ornithinimicrobium kibberense]|uniref:hypothetical protein n=1 Tax=Ornithinimicrobium kibberense TaxID=282060 RepID=UPI00361DF488
MRRGTSSCSRPAPRRGRTAPPSARPPRGPWPTRGHAASTWSAACRPWVATSPR